MVSVSQALVCGALAVAGSAAITAAQEPAAPQSLAVAPQGNVTLQGFTYNKCHTFDNENWGGIQHACSWMHYDVDHVWYNVFLRTYTNIFGRECNCQWDVRQYTFDSSWSYSRFGEINCYTRDGRSAESVYHLFDSVPNCPSPYA